MKRALALLTALLLLGAFASCGKPADDTTTAAPAIGGEYTTRAPAPPEETTEATGEDTTLPAEETTLEAETTSEEAQSTLEGETTAVTTTTAKAPDIAAPTGTAAIVKFYNEAANNAKKQKNFSVNKSDKLECHITEGFLTIVDGALNDLRKDSPNQQETFKGGKGTLNTGRTPNSFLPVENQPYMSQLQAGWVKSATCVKNGNGAFTVKLTLNTETVLAKSEDARQHHSCMDTLNVDWNNLGFEVEDSTTATMHDATITATVTPDGKLLQELHIYEPVTVKGRIRILAWFNLTVDGYWKQDITFTW